jgi:hypothetical protein
MQTRPPDVSDAHYVDAVSHRFVLEIHVHVASQTRPAHDYVAAGTTELLPDGAKASSTSALQW